MLDTKIKATETFTDKYGIKWLVFDTVEELNEHNRTCGIIVWQALPEGAKPPKLIPYLELGLEDHPENK